MRLVIDLQAAQAAHSNRGIGKYALSLVQGLLRNATPDVDIHISLNGAFSNSIQEVRHALSTLVAQENIHLWYPLVRSDRQGDSQWRDQASGIVRDAFINSLNADVVLVTSLFEGFHDLALTSSSSLSIRAPVAIILYDLIPMVMEQSYLSNDAYRHWYMDKISQLRRADLHLCISEATRRQSIDLLTMDSHKVENISAAVDEQFQPLKISAELEAQCRSRTGVSGNFVLYTGGIDPRKNIEGLIRAFSLLPASLQNTYQLAVVCAIQEPDRLRLNALARECGLAQGTLQLTGYVSDEDLLTLYNLCSAFVFPSLLEGFGLPVLEAMQCGCPVIASDCSSIPEVVGLKDALFDPSDDSAISALLTKVLQDRSFRETLIQHGLQHASKFSWDETAVATLSALKDLCSREPAQQRRPVGIAATASEKPKLAFVSPLPPEQSGIADYSAELLPALAVHYTIDVVVEQPEILSDWVHEHCELMNSEAFRLRADNYDRILYHFGNSTFHQHMFELLESYPGTVVLHDAYLSGILAHMEIHGLSPGAWVRALYNSHGYVSIAERFGAADTSAVVWKYPCNIDVIRRAMGVIVHSQEPVRQTKAFYGPAAVEHFAVIPLLKSPAIAGENRKSAARKALGIADNKLLVCSFGLLGPTKLNHRLLDAWLESALANNSDCMLVFVGENHDGPYGQQIVSNIKRHKAGSSISITGWADKEVYLQYLEAADIGVQLRTLSRGETSAAVLDCMKYGLATIVNKNGSMNDLPDSAVMKLPDDFQDAQLAEALSQLGTDVHKRTDLGILASKEIALRHAPQSCGEKYAQAIERFYNSHAGAEYPAVSAITKLLTASSADTDLMQAAVALDKPLPEIAHIPTLMVDVSELVKHDAGTGIQRVVKNILKCWLNRPQSALRIEPVYATAERPGYRYARKFTLDLLGVSDRWLTDEPISYRAGDVFIGLDLQPHVVPAQRDYLQAIKRHGVSVQFVVYDLLPIMLSDCFVDGGADMLTRWLSVVAQFDGAVCISQSVANELDAWLSDQSLLRSDFQTSWFHLGAIPATDGISQAAPQATALKPQERSFLMVGTLEPRKGHAQVLSTFERLWREGVDLSLTIVGKQGWMVDELVARLRAHEELNKRLFWYEAADDSQLRELYNKSSCLIAASRGEGFGLPLVEAAQFGLAIIARDIPVFREVAGDAAWYFDGETADGLFDSIGEWLELYQRDEHPHSINLPWLTWEASSDMLLQQVLKQAGRL